MITDEALSAYLDGEVDLDRAREIEHALAADPALRVRLARLRTTDGDLRAAFDALAEAPVPPGLEQLVRARAAGAGEDQAAVIPFAGAAARANRRPGWAPPAWVGWAIAAQLLVIVLAGLVLARPGAPAGQYRALGSAPVAPTADLMVIFRPETPIGEVRRALDQAGARVVDGPTPTGALLLHVSRSRLAAARLDLKRRPDVVLAEPIESPGAR